MFTIAHLMTICSIAAGFSITPSSHATVSSPVSTFAPNNNHFPAKRIPNTPRRAKNFDLDEIENRAVAASEAWDTVATPFLDAPAASRVEERLGNRADCAALRAGGYPGSSRCRFVFTNPELGLDADAASAEFVAVLRVSNADLRNSDPIPNVLESIGVGLDDVGDIVFDGDDVAYIVVTPGKCEKACVRLLPKELVGAGITVDPLGPGESVPEDGDLQDMEVQRLDKREQKRRK
mmetsp:Transcript_29098/g.35448  ORF Transcript_29098/g.35448 Transcript_29098/m.35448 type:complete len:235 (+) Transcript_29098:104-808(+)|eukprot:CAMPEP_0172513836 /NCGR_PEP_ID=MMETSP1066-20121228/255861_1 /TAXON_ID=671091 /ORGANISM="Coscinodiscus wailesii, Strain CCMP2513" /LENGTH=234 /DNA_ID=CAMNT_0013294275 /DNA_START=90 /DNA_END=794 /DNA_ORIENTATION=+